MYEDGKEPQVRFQVDLSLTEILRVGDGDMDSEQAVELAVICKLVGRAEPTRWNCSASWSLLRQVLMASAMSRGDYVDAMPGDGDYWDYGDLLVRYQIYADFLARDAEQKMRDFDAAADLEWVIQQDAA